MYLEIPIIKILPQYNIVQHQTKNHFKKINMEFIIKATIMFKMIKIILILAFIQALPKNLTIKRIIME